VRALRIALAVVLLGLVAGGSTATGQVSTGSIVAFEADADVYAAGAIALVTEVIGLPVEVYATRARASMDSGPRATAIAGPADVPLGAAFGLLGIPIELPTSCQAFFPGAPTADCGAVPGDAPGAIVGVGSGHAEADGEADDIMSVTASATAASSSVKSPLFRLGAAQSTASTDVDDGRLTARSALKLSDVRLAGGAVQIDGVSSSARAESTGQREGAKVAANLAITEGSIAGIVPFTVNDDGIRFQFPGIPNVPVLGVPIPLPQGEQGVPAPVGDSLRQALDPVTSQLTALGIEMKVVPGVKSISEDGTTVNALSAALQVTFRLPNSANRVTVEIGRASARAYATPDSEDASGEPLGGDTPSAGGGFDDGGPGVDTGSAPLPDLGEVASPAGPSAPSGEGGSDAPPAPALTTPIASGRDLFERARIAYLATLIGLTVLGAGSLAFGPVRRTMFSEARRSVSHGSN